MFFAKNEMTSDNLNLLLGTKLPATLKACSEETEVGAIFFKIMYNFSYIVVSSLNLDIVPQNIYIPT